MKNLINQPFDDQHVLSLKNKDTRTANNTPGEVSQEQSRGAGSHPSTCWSHKDGVRLLLLAIAAAMALLSLTQLLDAATGTPDAPTVNIRALRDLLQAMLGHLGLQDRSTRGLERPAERDRARTLAAGHQPLQPGQQLPAKDPLQDTASGSEADVAADVGQLVEKVETHESSSSKDTAGYQDLLEEMSQMKEAQSRVQEEIRMMQEALGLGNLRDAAGRLPGLCTLRTLASDVQMLKERLGPCPDPDEVNNTVHRDVLEDCLLGSKGDRGRDGGRPRGEQERDQPATTKPPTSDMDTPHGASSVLGSRGSSLGPKDPGTALTAPKQHASVPSDQRRDASATAMVQTVSQDAQTTSLGTQTTQPESAGTQTTSLGTQPKPTVTQTTTSGEQPSTQLHWAGPLEAGTLFPTAQGFHIPPDTDSWPLCHLRGLALSSASSTAYHDAYNCYVDGVEALKQIVQVRHLYAALKEQVGRLEATKLDRTELEKLRLHPQEGGQERVAKMLGDLQAQVSSMQGRASDLQGLSRDLKGVARELQGEKGKIRKLESALGKLEADRASWQMDLSNQLSLPLGSTPQEVKRDMKDVAEQRQISKAALDQLVTQMAKEELEQLNELRVTESTGQEEAACPVCSSDASTRLGKLMQRYEKLRGLVDSLMLSKKRAKVVKQLPGKSQEQDQEALKRVQAAILQMQGEYEKLNSVTRSLLADSRQQQKDIEGLFQSMERLEKEKADKEDLELGMDEKADKGALESKVSRAQFEASLELLKERNQEVLSRVTGQEQRLHEVQQQLREEMATKLDRLELGPFQQRLDEQWKSRLEQLKEMAPPTEADDAAGIRKQLLADFQCLSCERQLSMRMPGSPIPPIPSFPPLVPHIIGQSHPVLKTEQTHRERMAAGRYPTVPRQCGGRHTLTHPLQRSVRLQPLQPSAPQALQPSTLLSSKHDKTEQLGQDSRRADPCRSAPGTTGPLEDRSASSHSHLRQVHRPHPPLQPHRMDAVTREPGRTWGHRLNPSTPAPQLARK